MIGNTFSNQSYFMQPFSDRIITISMFKKVPFSSKIFHANSSTVSAILVGRPFEAIIVESFYRASTCTMHLSYIITQGYIVFRTVH